MSYTQNGPPITMDAASEQALRRVAAVYGRFYAPIAILVAALTFTAPFQDVVLKSYTSSFGTLFDMAGTSGGGPAAMALLLIAVLVGLLAYAGIGAQKRWVPVTIIVFGLILILMLITRPNTGSPKPELSDFGAAELALGIIMTIVAAIHVIHLTKLKR